MKEDIPEKGAALQRDHSTFAIAPHSPGGLISVNDFKKVVDVAEKYKASAMKITSAQRIAIIGVQEEDIDVMWKELEMAVGHIIGVCVRMVKFCPGTTWCRHGKQDAVGMGMKLDRLYHGYCLPAKFKIGVAGCKHACTAPAVKEIGLCGRSDGWTLMAGGNCGARPRIGDVIAKGIDDETAMDITQRIVAFFETCDWAKKMRLARVIEKIGFDEFKRAIGV